MQIEDEGFYRARMLEEQTRAQTCLGEAKQFHLQWAALYEERLRELTFQKEKREKRKCNLGRALNVPTNSHDPARNGQAPT